MAAVPLAAQPAQNSGQEIAPDPVGEARARLAEAEKAHPGNTTQIAGALIQLVQRQCVSGRVGPETMELAQRAVAVAGSAQGKDSALYAMALASLAKVHLAENHAEQGRPIAEQALEVARRAAPGTRDLAQTADALDKICFAMGDTRCALSAAEEAVAAERASHEPNGLYLASMLQDLGQIRVKLRDWAGARLAVEESLKIVDSQAEPAPSMAILESNAGAFFSLTGDGEAAIVHLNKALTLSKSLYGADSVQVAHALMNLGYLNAKTGHLDESMREYDAADSLYRKWYGPLHSRTSILEAHYARVLGSAGDLNRALEMAIHAHQSQRETFSLAVRVLPERQALALAANERIGLNVGLSIVVEHPEVDPAPVYQEEIRSRALVAEEMAHRQVALNRQNDPQIAVLLGELDKERSEVLASTGAEQNQANERVYTAAMMRMERTERELAERSLAFRTDEQLRLVSLEDVRRHLPAQSVLISYVSYLKFPPKFNPGDEGKVQSYMAFVLRPGSEKIHIFDLGEQDGIDALVKRCRAAADAEAHSGGLGSTRNERAYRAAALDLRKKIWDPLQADVAGAKLVLVAPDGDLNLIPFAALPVGNGYLVDKGPVIHLLSSERDLLPAPESPHKNGLLAIGSPSFDIAAASLPASPLRDATVPCDEFRSLQFRPLPGSAAEVTDISSAWKRWNRDEASSLVTGADATRSRFVAEAERNRVLHVATHAFVLDKSCGNGNPLLHSGLVFAGANQLRSDSILTAQQIASLNLNGVDWAVLSACNTGSGLLQDGEGVLGLERAFRVAGAHSVVMALWPVDDYVTGRFMHELYAERLKQRASTADAVWRSLRKLLAERRAAGKSTHPWYWAGFVAAGGWQ